MSRTVLPALRRAGQGFLVGVIAGAVWALCTGSSAASQRVRQPSRAG